MVILHGFISVCAYKSLLEIVLAHLTLMILLSNFLWNTSMLFSRVRVNVHSSKLYMKILWVYVVNTLILILSLTCLLLKVDSNFLYELIALFVFWYLLQCRVLIRDICPSSKHLLHLFTFLFCFHLHPRLLWATKQLSFFHLDWFSTRQISGIKYHQHTLDR